MSEKPRKPRKPRGFDETQAPFRTRAAELAPLFEAYGYRCAFTDADLRAEAQADLHGAVVRLNGASNAPGEVIPACLDAINAFERRHLAIGTRHEFLIAKDVIDPEFEERLRAIGRLELPVKTTFHPNPALLERHRQRFADGKPTR